MVELSAREINRIVCPGPMTDLIFSEEKGLTGHFSGNNAFVKFTAEEVGGKLKYSKEPSEIHVVCNGSVYTIIGAPAEINAATVRLALDSPANASIDTLTIRPVGPPRME